MANEPDHHAICEAFNVWLWNNLAVDHPVRVKWNEIWKNPPMRHPIYNVSTTNPHQVGENDAGA